MTFNVHQPWDTLRSCVVGRSYPPEFYSWIQQPRLRSLFERIAQETEEDFQAIIAKLQQFGVEILRPEIEPTNIGADGKFLPPPMNPRDSMVMIGDRFFANWPECLPNSYLAVRDPDWPDCSSWQEFDGLPDRIRDECHYQFGFQQLRHMDFMQTRYQTVLDHVAQQGNSIERWNRASGATVARIGRDLYFGTETAHQDPQRLVREAQQRFPQHRCHVINTAGHTDGTFCPVVPGLIISLHDIECYTDTFPGWQVVYLEAQSWEAVRDWSALKARNQGRWWIPGSEHDASVIDLVETWMAHWVGYVEETVFDVNMLMIDPHNVMVFGHNDTVFRALEQHGVTPHIVPFRHRYFWDGGIHCVTLDLDRTGTQQDFFPERCL